VKRRRLSLSCQTELDVKAESENIQKSATNVPIVLLWTGIHSMPGAYWRASCEPGVGPDSSLWIAAMQVDKCEESSALILIPSKDLRIMPRKTDSLTWWVSNKSSA